MGHRFLTPEDIARDFVAYVERLERENPEEFALVCAALDSGADFGLMCSVPHNDKTGG